MTEEPKGQWRRLCTACWTEGRGDEPQAYPTCGSTDAWYEYNTSVDDTEPAREQLKRLLVPPDAGDEVPE